MDDKFHPYFKAVLFNYSIIGRNVRLRITVNPSLISRTNKFAGVRSSVLQLWV